MSVVEIKENEFVEKIKKSKNKVIIDCYANWCGPCRMLSPILDEISDENKNYDFYKLDIDEAEEISKKYGIMSIPTLLIFENNELKDKIIGLKSKEELNNILNK